MKPRLLFGAVCALIAGGIGALYCTTPVRVYEGKGLSRLTYDRDGSILDIQVAPDGRYRIPVTLREVPQACVEALLTYEDKHFYLHPGVNPLSLVRAAWSLFSGRPVGASTVTMQLVRLRSGLNTKSFLGKVSQMWGALVLERHFTKEAVLEGFFNFAPYGGGIEGIAAASAIYFAKAPSQLSRAECAALAVLPQAPTARFGFKGDEFAAAFERLGKELHIPEGERSLNFPTLPSLQPPHAARHLTTRLLSGGGVVRTTIDKQLQLEIENTLDSYIGSHAQLGVKNGTVLVVDARNGDILGYVGARVYGDAAIKGFVDGVSARRSPGSLLKPFVFAKAIDEGLIVPESRLEDIPIKLSSYEPENFEKNFLGLISAREALIKSRNIPALLLNSRLREDGLYTLLRSAGVSLPREAAYYGAAVVIGGIEVNALEVARLYAALATDGSMPRVHAMEQGTSVQRQPLLSREAAYLTWQMLLSNPPPPGFAVGEVAWKTGTSSGARDAWAAGMRGAFVVVVWLGNFDGSPNPNFVGRDIAGPLLFTIFERIRSHAHLRPWLHAVPQASELALAEVEICSVSGLLRTTRCPHGKHAKVIPGVSPIKTCDVHRESENGVITVQNSGLARHLSGEQMQLNARRRAMSTSSKARPHIISPETGVEYRLEFGREMEVEFRANVDGEATRIYWYVDGQLVGDTEPTKSLFWRAVPGTMIVHAVDSFGASDAVRIRVAPQEG